jgi:hypothetical protein
VAEVGGWWLRFVARRAAGSGSGAARVKEVAWYGSVWRRRKWMGGEETEKTIVDGLGSFSSGAF